MSLQPQSKEQLFPSRDVCWDANRRATSVQPHFFDSGSAAAAGGQERAGHTLFARLATGGRKVENFDSNGCAHGAREAGRRRRCIASCVEKRTGEATYARRRECENALELQGERAPAESPGQAIAREPWMHLIRQMITLDKRRQRYGRGGVHTENAWKQTRRQRCEVAGRKTSERARSTGT